VRSKNILGHNGIMSLQIYPCRDLTLLNPPPNFLTIET
jgi:hypothetical protein